MESRVTGAIIHYVTEHNPMASLTQIVYIHNAAPIASSRVHRRLKMEHVSKPIKIQTHCSSKISVCLKPERDVQVNMSGGWAPGLGCEDDQV